VDEAHDGCRERIECVLCVGRGVGRVDCFGNEFSSNQGSSLGSAGKRRLDSVHFIGGGLNAVVKGGAGASESSVEVSSYVSPFVFDEAWVGCSGEANFTEELSANEVMCECPCFFSLYHSTYVKDVFVGKKESKGNVGGCMEACGVDHEVVGEDPWDSVDRFHLEDPGVRDDGEEAHCPRTSLRDAAGAVPQPAISCRVVVSVNDVACMTVVSHDDVDRDAGFDGNRVDLLAEDAVEAL
jgi:hypothetical protein